MLVPFFNQSYFFAISTLIDHLGFAPDFIDGHQHIQQLPIIRDAILDVYLKFFPKKNPDEIQAARLAEYSYLNSDIFLQDCRDWNIKLIRFSGNNF